MDKGKYEIPKADLLRALLRELYSLAWQMDVARRA